MKEQSYWMYMVSCFLLNQSEEAKTLDYLFKFIVIGNFLLPTTPNQANDKAKQELGNHVYYIIVSTKLVSRFIFFLELVQRWTR
jgi:hypothetical protein